MLNGNRKIRSRRARENFERRAGCEPAGTGDAVLSLLCGPQMVAGERGRTGALGSMNAFKTALVLVTLGMLHPGFAMFVVGLATLVVALQLALELSTGEDAVAASPVEGSASPDA